MPFELKYDFFLHNEPNAEYSSLREALDESPVNDIQEFIDNYIEGLLDSSHHQWLFGELADLLCGCATYSAK